MVNLCGRFKSARANLIVSRSGSEPAGSEAGGDTLVEAPQTAQLASPAPTMDPQLRHNVGRPELLWLG